MAIFGSVILNAQTFSSDPKVNSSISSSPTDSLIKREIAFFTISGTALRDTSLQIESQLKEIPIRYCSDKEVYLSWDTFTSSVSTFINIYFKEENSRRVLESISLVTHSHFLVKFPDVAFQGLPQTHSCNYSTNGKEAAFFSPYYKAFYSTDKRRLYIYMLGGTEVHKYEVTWVIVDDSYYSRIVNKI